MIFKHALEIDKIVNFIDSFARETQRTIIVVKKNKLIIANNHQDNTKQ